MSHSPSVPAGDGAPAPAAASGWDGPAGGPGGAVVRLSEAWRLVRRNPLSRAGALMAALLVLVSLAAPLIAPYPGDAVQAVHPEQALLPPSWAHPFGTDDLGRDLLSRVLVGGRISLAVGGVTILLALAIGVPLGMAAGYFGGRIDEVIMRVTDVFLGFPPLLLALAIGAMLGPSLTNLVVAIAISWWPWYTRIARTQAMAVKAQGYVEAARAAGAAAWRIIGAHVLPNAVAPVVIQASMDFGSVVLTSAALGFLGLGASPPTPEWGLIVSVGRTYFPGQWWYVTFPGLAIFLMAMAFNLLGDGLRELLNPRARRRRV